MKTTSILATSVLAGLAVAAPVQEAANLGKRNSATCPSYTIINTRGTDEPQGESGAFTTMNGIVLSALAGGTLVNTVYPASEDQDSSAGTAFIIDYINNNLDTCYILEGYSQGAAATVNALPGITGAAFDAVVGVWLNGDPNHKPDLACNIDGTGGDATMYAVGSGGPQSIAIPDNWIPKVMDVCITNDGVCDVQNGIWTVNWEHLSYGTNQDVQAMGAAYLFMTLDS